MSTLVEIEEAAGRLSPQERRELLFFLARGLRSEQALPPARLFTADQVKAWMDEDELDMKALKEQA